MNGTETRADEIARYLDGVRAALLDLPADVRDELLEDLPDHLAEVASEDPGALEARLGTPAGYAAELRTAAGLRPGPAEGDRPGLAAAMARLAALATRSAAHGRRADLRLGRLIGYPRLSDFVRLLRPGWWVLRGYALAVVLANVDMPESGVIPSSGGSLLVRWLLVLGCVVGSIWFGRQSGRWRGARSRYLPLAANLVFAVLAIAMLSQLDDAMRDPAADGQPVEDRYQYVTDVIPVGPDGKPLSGVRLYDQNGNELELGQPSCDGSWVSQPEYRYPLCLNPNAVIIPKRPDGRPLSSDSPQPSPGGSNQPSPGVSAQPSAGASAEPSPGGSARPSPSVSPAGIASTGPRTVPTSAGTG
jgi:hypothetical protein